MISKREGYKLHKPPENDYTLVYSNLSYKKFDNTQGVVTPIGAILKAATGDMTKSPGHGGFFSSVTESRKVFKMAQNGHRVKASRFKHNARDPFYFIYAVVTRTTRNFEVWSRGHSQI